MRFDPLELSLESKVELVSTIDEVVRDVATLVGFSEAAAADIELAVHEAIVNAIVHGGAGDAARAQEGARVEIRLAHEGDALVVEVRDRGAGFDPDHVPSPLDEARRLVPSGRGIFTMRTFMDEVDYSARPEGGTIVRMTKRLPPEASYQSREER